MNLPAPLVPEGTDLRNFPSMLLEVQRLRDSELASAADAELFRTAVLSWCVAWHQVPAASLPNDDATLARMLGFGRDVKGWKRLREAGALRGWVLCAPHEEGKEPRLYHPVVAEKALEAMATKQSQRLRTEVARAKAEDARARRLLQSGGASVTGSVTDKPTDDVTASNRREGKGTEGKGGGESAPPTPRDLLVKELRALGLSSAPTAVDEWSAFLTGSCDVKTPDEIRPALRVIAEDSVKAGSLIAYAKHAAAFASNVKAYLTKRRARDGEP